MAIIAGLSQDTILQIGTYQNRYFEQTKVIYTVPSRVKMLNYVFSCINVSNETKKKIGHFDDRKLIIWFFTNISISNKTRRGSFDI